MPGLIDSIVSDLARRGLEAEQVGEADRAAEPGDRAEAAPRGRCRRSMNSPVEVTLPRPFQSIRPCPLIVPGTSAITPSVRRVSSSGCRPSPKCDAGHVEHAHCPPPVDRRCVDRDVGDPRPARRMLERSGRADHAVGQREVHVVAAQRIEFRRVGAVGDGQRRRRSSGRHCRSATCPRVAELQRDLADRRVAAGERAADARCRRRCRCSVLASISTGDVGLPEPQRERRPRRTRAGRASARCAASSANGELPSRPRSRTLRVARRTASAPPGAAARGSPARSGRAAAASGRAAARRLQAGEARVDAAFAERERCRRRRTGRDRHSQARHPPAGNGPSSSATVSTWVEPSRRAGEADRREREPRPAGGIRRDVGDAAHRRAAARLAKRDPRRRQPAALQSRYCRRRAAGRTANNRSRRRRPTTSIRAPLGRARRRRFRSAPRRRRGRLTSRSEPSTSNCARRAADRRARSPSRSARAACPWPTASGPVMPGGHRRRERDAVAP